ncbi:MAG: nitroreductase family deazaflavin-dependent oxidoreductase [Actinomycetota bacterium]
MQVEGEYEPSPWDWVRNQVEAYESSGGRSANMLGNSEWPVVIVTSRGRRTGTLRKTPLMRVEHEGEYALIGSLGGAPKNPVWVYNLRADPNMVTLQDGPEPFAVTVREVTGDERALWWERAVAAYPPYELYQKNTERLIPVFVATRLGDNEGS